jgi:hypothetical protein
MGAPLSETLAPAHQPLALENPPAELAADTLALCQIVREAEERHFPAWCRVADNRHSRRPRELPVEIVEIERERLAELAAVVEALREHCESDLTAAERACHALMRAQVEGDLALTAALRVTRGGDRRQELRAASNERRAAIFETRDTLCCACGWPHRGEIVLVTAWIYSNDHDGGKFTHDGEAIYDGSHDIHNVSHTVDVPGLELNRGVLHLAWEPHVHWGNADPDGDIAMRVASRPTHPLPCPLPRWPKESDVADLDERSRIAVGEQIALL